MGEWVPVAYLGAAGPGWKSAGRSQQKEVRCHIIDHAQNSMENMQTHWAFVWWCSCLPVQTHFTCSNLFARDVAEHTFDSVGIIPWKFLGLRRLKARILPKVFLAPLRQCHAHYTRAGFDCLIANLPNRAKAWSEWDVKEEATWDAKKETTWDDKQESTWDVKQTSTWDVKQESAWGVKQESTWDVKQESAWDVKKESTWDVKETTWDPKKETVWDVKQETTWDVKKEGTWDVTKETTWDVKKKSTWDVKKETTWNVKQEITWDVKEKTAGLSCWRVVFLICCLPWNFGQMAVIDHNASPIQVSNNILDISQENPWFPVDSSLKSWIGTAVFREECRVTRFWKTLDNFTQYMNQYDLSFSRTTFGVPFFQTFKSGTPWWTNIAMENHHV